MKAKWWLVGLNILLVVALLLLAGFTQQLRSQQSQLLERSTSLEKALGQARQDLLTQMSQVGEGFSQDLATATEGLKKADEDLGQKLAAQSDRLSADLANAQSGLQGLRSQLQGTQSQLAAAEAALSKAIELQGATLGQEIKTASAKLQELQADALKLSSFIARALIDFNQLYNQVRDSVVEVRVNRATGQGIASGFLYGSQRLYIITAYHVIEGASQIRVVTSGGAEISASLVGGDSVRDVALLRLGRSLSASPLNLADSSQVVVGQPVMVVGSPFGETASASSGIVSGVGRQATWDSKSGTGLIQFDAAVNFGNSGGPLLNAKGEVIGLVVARIDPTLGEGVSFAIPANTVRPIVDPLLR